jgi:hypothetical protein
VQGVSHFSFFFSHFLYKFIIMKFKKQAYD